MEKNTLNTNDCEDEVLTLTCKDKTSEGINIDQLKLEKCLYFAEAMLALRSENIDLKNKLLLSEQKSRDLQSDIQVLLTLAQDAGQSLNSTCSNLVSLSDDLAKLCPLNDETPNCTLLDHHKNDNPSFDIDLLSAMQSQFKSDTLTSRPHAFQDLQALSNTVVIKKRVDTISTQIKYLQKTILINKDKLSDAAAGDKDVKEAIFKLKSLLSIKREQIATLRTNKETAEVAVTKLKPKYENENLITREEISQLHDKLKILKEKAATNSSLRADFAARCKENKIQFLKLARRQKLELEGKLEMHQLEDCH